MNNEKEIKDLKEIIYLKNEAIEKLEKKIEELEEKLNEIKDSMSSPNFFFTCFFNFAFDILFLLNLLDFFFLGIYIYSIYKVFFLNGYFLFCIYKTI